jgi:hypothetical protein
VIKTGESLWVSNLGVITLVVIWLSGSRVKLSERRLLTLRLVVIRAIGLLITGSTSIVIVSL